MASRHPLAGFTLFEALLTLALAGILMVAAVPSYRSWHQKTTFTTHLRAFKNLLILARSSAIQNNLALDVCPSSDHQNCSGDWNWNQDVIVRTGRGDILAVYQCPEGLQIQWRGNLSHNTQLRFTPVGATFGQQGSFVLKFGGNEGRITVNHAGRVKEIIPSNPA